MTEATLPASVVDAVEAHLAGRAAAEAAAEAANGNGPVDGRGRSTAAVILDVLRAGGWLDPGQAQQLQKEAERLRELLDMVVRDHRAREALAARGQTQQRDWLVPLLRAAHGMEQGTLEAKAALREAVRQVPADIRSSAGLNLNGADPGDPAVAEQAGSDRAIPPTRGQGTAAGGQATVS
jgi:hypothetical protein